MHLRLVTVAFGLGSPYGESDYGTCDDADVVAPVSASSECAPGTARSPSLAA